MVVRSFQIVMPTERRHQLFALAQASPTVGVYLKYFLERNTYEILTNQGGSVFVGKVMKQTCSIRN